MKGNNPDSKVLGFTGHMDVVPVGDTAWTYPPFDAEEIDGKIYGRGSGDMKSGLLAFVIAMINLKEDNIPFEGTVKLLVTAAEESGCLGAKQLTELGYADDLDALIAGECSFSNIYNAERGVLFLRLTTTGGNVGGEDVNAIEQMIYFLKKFEDHFDFSGYTDELLGIPTSSLDILNGGTAKEVLPETCVAEFDIRTNPQLDHQQFIAEVEALKNEVAAELEGFQLEIEAISDLPATYASFDDPFIQVAASVVESVTGVEQGPLGYPGATDVAEFSKAAKTFPCIVLGPGRSVAHRPDEYVVIDDYLNIISIYQEIATRFLQPANPQA
ncbi:MAG: M20/M25/M40 family metallo-hydrolase [Tannerellaceae bacterium]|nr:M20/M25/M40 family metallo-hydrolase [Tannerellaceae bacterium]